MKMKFHQVPISAQFTFFECSYVKLALSVGQDAEGIGHVFQYEAEVESEAIDPDPLAGFPRWEGYGRGG